MAAGDVIGCFGLTGPTAGSDPASLATTAVQDADGWWVPGLKGPFSCLNEARYGIMWGAMGAARDAYEVALLYALERRQFGGPLAAFQLTQQKLVDMVLEIQKGVLVATQIGRLKDARKLRPEQISFGNLNNVREAIAVCLSARTILSGNGVTAEYSPLRHANSLESVRTYEGTDEIHTLIVVGQSPEFRPSRDLADDNKHGLG